jgi:anaerobic selenocysteine-containing dehydrogenase
MKYFCSKDCPDLCEFELINNKNNISFKALNANYLKNNFVCSKLRKFYVREVNNQCESYFLDNNGNKQKRDTIDVANKLIDFLKTNINKKMLFLRGSGSIAYNMTYWDLIMSYFPNTFYIDGSPCDETGILAHIEDFGLLYNPDIRNLEKVEVIFIFGKNAKVTSPHLYAYIKSIKNNGKKIIYIDPVQTETANIADYYIPVNPGSDNILCALILKKLNLIDNKLDEERLYKYAGINYSIIDKLAKMIKLKKTAFITGYGLQRYKNGKNIVKWINRLAYLTDNLEYLYYSRSSKSQLRKLNINKNNIVNITEVNHLLKNNFFDIIFVVASNPAITYPDSRLWKASLKKSTLIVVDPVETETTKYANYYIKVGGMFCQEDIQGSYFFNILSFREERAVKNLNLPSDLDVIKILSDKLNAKINIASVDELIVNENDKDKIRVYKTQELKLVLPSRADGKYRLLTNSHKAYLNSQYLNEDLKKDNYIYVASNIAFNEGIKDGNKVMLYNKNGCLIAICKVCDILNNVILIYKNRLLNGNSPNVLTESIATDGYNGLAYYDTFVNISTKINEI